MVVGRGRRIQQRVFKLGTGIPLDPGEDLGSEIAAPRVCPFVPLRFKPDRCALCSTLSTALTEGQPHIKSSLPDGHPQSTSETWSHITPPLSPYAPEKTEYLLSLPLFHALAMLSPQPRAPLCHLCVSKPTYPPGPVKSHLFPEAFPHPFIRV